MTDTPVVQARQKDRGKTDGRNGSAALYNARRDGWQHGMIVCHQKKFEKFSTFFARSIRVPDLEYLSRYSDPGDRWFFGLEDSRFPPGFLVKTGQFRTFVVEGCRGNLNRASGQAAL